MGKRFYSGGRKPGTPNRIKQVAEAVIARDITPLDVMLETMREFRNSAKLTNNPETKEKYMKLAADVANDAAPYLHAKLQPVDANGNADLKILVKIVKYGGD